MPAWRADDSRLGTSSGGSHPCPGSLEPRSLLSEFRVENKSNSGARADCSGAQVRVVLCDLERTTRELYRQRGSTSRDTSSPNAATQMLAPKKALKTPQQYQELEKSEQKPQTFRVGGAVFGDIVLGDDVLLVLRHWGSHVRFAEEGQGAFDIRGRMPHALRVHENSESQRPNRACDCGSQGLRGLVNQSCCRCSFAVPRHLLIPAPSALDCSDLDAASTEDVLGPRFKSLYSLGFRV